MHDEPLKTCLSSEIHNDNIKEHLIHFLGCIDISDRHKFLYDDNHSVWKSETEHYVKLGKSQDKARKIAQDKRKRWMSDCQSELRRIDFLREKLARDTEDNHLVWPGDEVRNAKFGLRTRKLSVFLEQITTNTDCCKEMVKISAREWKQSDEFVGNIGAVRKWRAKKGKFVGEPQICYTPAPEIAERPYDTLKDVNVPFIEFKDSMPVDEEPIHGVWGSFPDQKITMKNLLDAKSQEHNLLYKERFPERIKYFHLPSNNMEWAEKAIARYFNQDRPNLNALGREVQRQEKTQASLILKESHWRGQLHGGQTDPKSRFMRPFCEAISSNLNEVESIPKNLVLFMPYMHWETSRNRERFAQLIEELVFKRKKERRIEERKEKIRRQNERRGLKRRDYSPVVAKRNSSILGDLAGCLKEDDDTDDEDTQFQNDSEDDQMSAPPDGRRQLHSTSRIFTMGSLLQKLKLPNSPLKIDERRRVSVENKLGQYLIDAARLFEGMTNYRDKKLLERFLISDAPMHPRRTLDQAYYWSLNTTRSRDRDQVVYRATTADPASFHTYDHDKRVWDGHGDAATNKKHNDNKATKGYRACVDCTDGIKKVSRLVMVDQLWMWILDAKTIITCFPKRYGANKHDSSGVHKSVRIRLGEGRYQQVKSVFDLALIIFEECSNTFFDRTRTTDKQPQVLDAFSEAIGNVMHRQTVGFERLWRWTEEARKIYRSGSDAITSDLHVPLLDINPEGELEKEIKDIVEELGIMVYINKEHRDVLKQFITHVDHILDPFGEFGVKTPTSTIIRNKILDARRIPVTIPLREQPDPMRNDADAKAAVAAENERRDTYRWFKVNADEMMNRVSDRIEQLEELERSAEATASSVKDLLDLKSQQAGVVQAWQAVQQSNEAIKQGRAIMIFTIVTIIFLPLSFMSSIFGMNSIEFSDGNNMNLQEQFTYMFGVSAAVIAITLLFSLSAWSRAAVWYAYKRITTSFFVHTGLYQKYLNVDLPSSKLYRHAIGVTDKLKDKEVQTRLDQRRRKRLAEEKKRNASKPLGEANGVINGEARGGNSDNGSSESGNKRKSAGWWNCTNADKEDVEMGSRV